jgi:hypothetical protein
MMYSLAFFEDYPLTNFLETGNIRLRRCLASEVVKPAHTEHIVDGVSQKGKRKKQKIRGQAKSAE